ncbi:helix-turn-helix domain-containing protein [Streptomyces diastatochromogenes]|uniref:winged helix-turn-helix domain-containing protein n=1 Tax=Streptomyces diastatochromogenes TaxID=42236 RepID=UPI00366A0723
MRPKEFDLLALLARNPGTAVSRETLMAQVWDENWFGPTKTLDVTMAGLRRRLTQAAEESGRPAGCLTSPHSEGMATASSPAAGAMGPGRRVDGPRLFAQ